MIIMMIVRVVVVATAPNVKLGTLCVTSPGGHEYTSEVEQPAAIQLAVDHAAAAGILSGWNVSLYHEDITILRDLTAAGGISADSVVTNIAQRLSKEGVVASVGAGYSSEAVKLAPALAAHDIILVSQSATAKALSNSTAYPFFGRAVTPDSFQVACNLTFILYICINANGWTDCVFVWVLACRAHSSLEL
eukprot:COSAG05_NODE_6365_length_973_cov_1.456522_1_plen_191_part_00